MSLFLKVTVEPKPGDGKGLIFPRYREGYVYVHGDKPYPIMVSSREELLKNAVLLPLGEIQDSKWNRVFAIDPDNLPEWEVIQEIVFMEKYTSGTFDKVRGYSSSRTEVEAVYGLEPFDARNHK